MRHEPGDVAAGGHREASESFPGGGIMLIVRRLPAYARLVWGLARDDRVPPARRAALLAAAAYLVSPIDLVPGIIPVIGQLDDLLVVLAAVHVALSGLPPEQRLEQLLRAGLGEAELAEDLATLAASGRWLTRSGLRAGERALRTTAVTATWIAVRSLRAGRAGASSLASRARDRRRRPRSTPPSR